MAILFPLCLCSLLFVLRWLFSAVHPTSECDQPNVPVLLQMVSFKLRTSCPTLLRTSSVCHVLSTTDPFQSGSTSTSRNCQVSSCHLYSEKYLSNRGKYSRQRSWSVSSLGLHVSFPSNVSGAYWKHRSSWPLFPHISLATSIFSEHIPKVLKLVNLFQYTCPSISIRTCSFSFFPILMTFVLFLLILIP